MNVRTLCLAILHHQDATGYEIRKLSAEGKYSYFVDASFGSIYPALAKLEDEGLVSSRQEQQVGKPPRKVYIINDAGRQVLRLQLQEGPSPDIFRSEFLLIGMCSDLLDAAALAHAIDSHIAHVDEELSKIDQMAQEIADKECSWMADYGRNCMQAQLTWLQANRARILAGKASAANHDNRRAADALATAAE
jgi:PadR family transcriptional regulator, regulatory protein AphA